MSNPQAYITVGKSRVHIEKNNTVYLGKNVEFEIELYNPTSDRVGALISINGKVFPNKFILRPGETAHIERYLDEAKKFKFDTYTVDGSAETKQAIKDNGGVTVQFFREKAYVPSYQPNITINNNWWDGKLYSRGLNTGGTGDFTFGTSNSTSTNYSANLSNSNISMSNTSTMDFMDNLESNYKGEQQSRGFKSKGVLNSTKLGMAFDAAPKPVETGRVEKGGYSNQTFGTTSIDLEYWAFHTITLKLLPVSQRPEEATAYCSNCGRRNRAKENFCPKCGQKH